MRATTTPRRTKNMKIPAVPDTAEINPSLVIVEMVPMRPKLLYISAPATTPINRELYTSFVMSASAMAKTGGKSAKQSW